MGAARSTSQPIANSVSKPKPVPPMPISMRILQVGPEGHVNKEDLDSYLCNRRVEVGRCVKACLDTNAVARRWYDELSEEALFDVKEGEKTYAGDGNAEGEAKAALARAKATQNPVELVSAVEDLILYFCGFNGMKPNKAVCIVNALHFQYNVDVDKLLGTSLPLPSADGAPTDAVKAIFDEANIGAAELLLRCIVETGDGSLLANPFSPGQPMGKLLKLPLFAQFVMVLTNTVEAVWYEAAIPTCPMGINVYASLLVAEAPVLEMTAGANVVEIMEMTKGAKRGPEVDHWVGKIRETGAKVLLDDFDATHPGIGSRPDGIKACVFVNAYHSLQAFKNESLGDWQKDLSCLNKDKLEKNDTVDYYRSIVPKYQNRIQSLVMEGSENCLKSEIKGPPLNFDEPQATTASAHVYQLAARALHANQPEGQSFEMLHQGGRALYSDEDFDEDALAVIEASGKPMKLARSMDAGTMSWIGSEAVRRAAMQQRPRVCGVVKKQSLTEFK